MHSLASILCKHLIAFKEQKANYIIGISTSSCFTQLIVKLTLVKAKKIQASNFEQHTNC